MIFMPGNANNGMKQWEGYINTTGKMFSTQASSYRFPTFGTVICHLQDFLVNLQSNIHRIQETESVRNSIFSTSLDKTTLQ